MSKKEAEQPLILRAQRLMEAFAKSDDERDFYLDRTEGFIAYVDLSKSEDQLEDLYKELEKNKDRYCSIPKMSFYETKKIMENFVHDKVYDIDTKEKLLDIIGAKEARDNFLELLCDQPAEFDKWQQFYQERSRVRIIEWLRSHHFHFVFEEDLELTAPQVIKLKECIFEKKAPKEVAATRKILLAKAKTYYSNEALNPRPKRGRPPKQQQKTEEVPELTDDVYFSVPKQVRPFLFTVDPDSSALTFSSRFESEEALLAARKNTLSSGPSELLSNLNQKLESLKQMSAKWLNTE